MTGPLLLGVAGSLAVAHTAIGIDHVVPFVVLSQAQRWSLRRTLAVTAACGAGHVLSAAVIGALAVGLGLAVDTVAPLEVWRGRVAIALLVGFGLAYAAAGAVRAHRRRPHVHRGDGLAGHHPESHPGPSGTGDRTVSAWTLFVVLVFGPCEALVPLLLAPGVTSDWRLVVGVVTVFGVLTVATMLVLVAVAVVGVRHLAIARRIGARLAGTTDVMAGLAIAATGAAVAVLGL